MPRTPALDARGLRHRKHWPELSDEARELLFSFLGYWRAVAEDAAVKSGQIAEVASEDFGSTGNAKWWALSVRTIDWLMHRVVQKQQWMEIILAQKEGRWIPPDQEPGISSCPEGWDCASQPFTATDAPPPHGKPSDENSPKPSPQRPHKAGKRSSGTRKSLSDSNGKTSGPH